MTKIFLLNFFCLYLILLFITTSFIDSNRTITGISQIQAQESSKKANKKTNKKENKKIKKKKKIRKEYSATLAWNDNVITLAELIKSLDIDISATGRDTTPYTHNEHTAIWIGKEFPYKLAQQIIIWSQRYYSELRYIALSNFITPNIKRYDKNIYIGGSTQKALSLQLEPWSKADFKRLLKAKSQEQFRSYIQEKQGILGTSQAPEKTTKTPDKKKYKTKPTAKEKKEAKST